MKLFTLFVLFMLAVSLTGCVGKTEYVPATLTLLHTGVVVTGTVPFTSPLFHDDGSKTLKTGVVKDIQEIGGGMCLALVPSDLDPQCSYGILASSQLGLQKGSTVTWRFGLSLLKNDMTLYPVALSQEEVDALVLKGWHWPVKVKMATTGTVGDRCSSDSDCGGHLVCSGRGTCMSVVPGTTNQRDKN